jgi:Arc/MetJ-type ribon-helix-helix transcriptional regulator
MTNEGVKSMKKLTSRIALRLSDRERESAEQLIRELKFKNLSQVVRTAITDLLRKYQES